MVRRRFLTTRPRSTPSFGVDSLESGGCSVDPCSNDRSAPSGDRRGGDESQPSLPLYAGAEFIRALGDSQRLSPEASMGWCLTKSDPDLCDAVSGDQRRRLLAYLARRSGAGDSL